MIKLFKWLLGLCDHIWVDSHKVTLVDREYFGDDRPYGYEMKQRCTKCGKYRSQRL